MKLTYIAPSTLPSRAANAAHVALQCEGFVRAGARLTLVTKRAMADAAALPAALQSAYGVDASTMRLATFYSGIARADTLRIAWRAARDADALDPGGILLSRNIYAAWYFAVPRRRRMLFETHQLEFGVRKAMQRAIMTRPWVTTVVISEKLREILAEHHGVAPANPLVLHDAAPAGIEAVAPAGRRAMLVDLVTEAAGEWDAVCGYFGHLYPGRGVEVILEMARARPRCLFLLFGGNDADIAAHRARKYGENVRFMGFVPHVRARRIMTCVDVLLMPYQAKVSIGVARHDTARWMSPMKMFEYQAAGVPTISSDLPVLREVLQDGINALLVPADSAPDWVAALDRLLADPSLAARIGAAAHAGYRQEGGWEGRARRLLAAGRA